MQLRILISTLVVCLGAVSTARGQSQTSADTATFVCQEQNWVGGVCKRGLIISPKGKVDTKAPSKPKDTSKKVPAPKVKDSSLTKTEAKDSTSTAEKDSTLTPPPKVRRVVIDTTFLTCSLNRRTFAARVIRIKTGGGNCQLAVNPDSLLAGWNEAYPDLNLVNTVGLRDHILTELSERTCPKKTVALAHARNHGVVLKGWSRTLGDSLHPNELCGFNKEKNRYEVSFGSGNIILDLPGEDVAQSAPDTVTTVVVSPTPPQGVSVRTQVVLPPTSPPTSASREADTQKIIRDTLWVVQRSSFVKKTLVVSGIILGACELDKFIQKTKYCGKFSFHLHW